jgi:hypothetical protein
MKRVPSPSSLFPGTSHDKLRGRRRDVDMGPRPNPPSVQRRPGSIKRRSKANGTGSPITSCANSGCAGLMSTLVSVLECTDGTSRPDDEPLCNHVSPTERAMPSCSISAARVHPRDPDSLEGVALGRPSLAMSASSSSLAGTRRRPRTRAASWTLVAALLPAGGTTPCSGMPPRSSKVSSRSDPRWRGMRPRLSTRRGGQPRFGSARPSQHRIELRRGKTCEDRDDGQGNHHVDQGESPHLPPSHRIIWGIRHARAKRLQWQSLTRNPGAGFVISPGCFRYLGQVAHHSRGSRV